MSKVLSDDNELDVELDVVEQPEESNFPRRSNVVSHRGHQLRINVTINRLPPDRQFVTLAATVYSYGPERIGEQAHVFRSRKLWGIELDQTHPIDPEKLPQIFTIIVSEEGDDHLGQGPYDALVSINPTTEPPPPDELIELKEERVSRTANRRIGEAFVTSASIFSIEFTSM